MEAAACPLTLDQADLSLEAGDNITPKYLQVQGDVLNWEKRNFPKSPYIFLRIFQVANVVLAPKYLHF